MQRIDTNFLAEIRLAAKRLKGAVRRSWFAWAWRTGKVYTRVTGQSLRAILADSLGIAINQLPATRTMRRMLKRND